jgi:hypothetical protein
VLTIVPDWVARVDIAVAKQHAAWARSKSIVLS